MVTAGDLTLAEFQINAAEAAVNITNDTKIDRCVRYM